MVFEVEGQMNRKGYSNGQITGALWPAELLSALLDAMEA